MNYPTIFQKQAKFKTAFFATLLAFTIIKEVSAGCDVSNCNDCTDASDFICSQCDSDYYLKGGFCCQQYCSSCNIQSECNACINSSYTIDNSRCELCSSLINNCQQCTSPSSCTTCDPGFMNGGSECFICPASCSTCTSSSVCTACLNNSYALQSSQCTLCSSAIPNCIQCTSSTSCTICDSGYQNNVSSCYTCSTVISACATCTSDTVCTSCVDSYWTVKSTTNRCELCSNLIRGCETCASQTVCNTCASHLILNVSNCTSCSMLMEMCLTCNSSSVCTSCQSNLFAINSSSLCAPCLQLMVGCLHCSSSSSCIQCVNDSFAINPTGSQCAVCSYFMDFCTNCNSVTQCTKCESNPNIVLSNQRCVDCGTAIPNCLNCTSPTHCTLCNKYFIVNGAFTCSLCSNMIFGCVECPSESVCTKCSLGQVVVGGCSNIPGCISVQQVSKGAICTLCNSTSFLQTPTNGVCVCLKGTLAGKYCTQIIGCINAIQNINGIICSICDLSKMFILQNGTCACPDNYYLNNNSCKQVCGDGKVFYLPCDDGNNLNGDGCSSTCQVQSGYLCKDGDFEHKSICLYKGMVKLQYICTYKTDDNIAQVILTTNPFIPNILKSNLIMHFHPLKNCTIVSSSFNGQEIVLLITYLQSIEDSSANITIQYDKNYILSPNSTINVQFNECNGDRLDYEPNPSKSFKSFIIFSIDILNIAVVLVWFIGSYSHKMIGVETLHTFQLIFIPQTLATRYFPVLVNFGKLNNVLNLFQKKITSSAQLSSVPENRLNYSADFLYNNGIAACFQFIVLLIFIVSQIYAKLNRKFYQEKQKRDQHLNQNKCIELANMNKLKRIIYDFLVFPSIIGFLLNFMLSLSVYANTTFVKTFEYYYIQSLTIIFAMFSASFIYFWEWKQIVIKEKINQADQLRSHKKNYIPFYLTNFLILCFITEGSLVGVFSNPTRYFLGLTFIYTISIIIYKPYLRCIHNFGLFINNVGVLLNLCWLLSQEYIYLPRAKEEFLAIILLAWMALILIIAIIRIIVELTNKKSVERRQVKLQKVAQKPHQYEMQMIKAIEKQISCNVNSYLLESQLFRFKKDQEEQLKQRRRSKITHLQRKKYVAENSHGFEQKY